METVNLLNKCKQQLYEILPIKKEIFPETQFKKNFVLIIINQQYIQILS